MKQVPYLQLGRINQDLLEAAAVAMEKAYNPYSEFFVGAAILGANCKIITGSNVENASYGGTICAERAAILRANAEGIRIFDKIAIRVIYFS